MHFFMGVHYAALLVLVGWATAGYTIYSSIQEHHYPLLGVGVLGIFLLMPLAGFAFKAWRSK